MNCSGILSCRLFQTVVFSLIVLFPTNTVADDPYFETCIPKRCSEDGPNITYPFWIQGVQPSHCGYPGFNLTCSENDWPFLRMPPNEFEVRDIFYNNHSIFLLNQGYTTVDNCPLAVRNLTLDRTPFRSPPAQVQIYFFLRCRGRFPFIQGLYHLSIPCLTNSSHTSYAAINGGEVVEFLEFVSSCAAWVKVPVAVNSSPASLEPYLNQGLYTSLFDKGFLLNWETQNCDECTRTGGQCGYNWTTSEFSCFCRDRVHRVKCQGNDNRKPVKIAIGVGCGVGGILVTSLLFFLFLRRRRQRHLAASTILLSRDVSPDPSSKQQYDLEKCHSTLYTHIFSYKELEEATNNFDSSRELGDGGFGTVYFGKLRDGRSVAVKRLYENNYKRVEQFMNEVKILSSLRHQSLVTLFGCTSRHSRELLLVYEFIPNGTVADHLHGDHAHKGALTWPVRMNIAIETAEALAYLHAIEPPIIHRDVKTNNILLDSNFCVKVADFGLSRLFPVDVTHVSTTPQGTPGYVDPDYHKCYQLTDKSDVYSFGVVLMEIISSKPAVDITRHRHEINLANMAINKIHSGSLHELVDPDLGFNTDQRVRKMITLVAELGFRCLQEEKDMRPSMEEVVLVLKGIEKEDGMEKKTSELDNQMDDIGLLKSVPPLSPDSVMDNWGSKSTTPNASA